LGLIEMLLSSDYFRRGGFTDLGIILCAVYSGANSCWLGLLPFVEPRIFFIGLFLNYLRISSSLSLSIKSFGLNKSAPAPRFNYEYCIFRMSSKVRAVLAVSTTCLGPSFSTLILSSTFAIAVA
jgi:hypothetical protein